MSILCLGIPLLAWGLLYKATDGSTYEEVVARDGSVGCLLSGEAGTGLRGADSPPGFVGAGPLQAQQVDLAVY